MRSRHRLGKLLLRHGIVYNDGNAWTGKHHSWLNTHAVKQLPNRSVRLAFDADYDAVLATESRRDP